MLHSALGADMFDAGVRNYVQRNKHSSVRTHDLWEAMQGYVDVRAVEDQQTAASQVPGSDAVVVGDGSDEDDYVRVVVPGNATVSTPPRLRRHTDQVSELDDAHLGAG